MNALFRAIELQMLNALINDETTWLAGRTEQSFANQGMANTGQTSLSADMFKEQAYRRAALGLILAKLVEGNKLEPTGEQIKVVVVSFAESYEDLQEVTDWYYVDTDRLQGPISLAVEGNVINFVLGETRVTKKTLSSNEVMDAQA